MTQLAALVLRHRRLIFAFWLLALLAGGAVAGRTTERLSVDFSLPGQPGDAAERQMAREYGVSTFDTLVATVTVPQGETVTDRADDVRAVFDAVRAAAPQARVVDGPAAGGARFATDDGRTAFALVQGPLQQGTGSGLDALVQPALERAADRSGLESALTSYAMLSAGGENEGPSLLLDTLLGALGALAVLAFVFASFLAFVPLLIAAVSILTTFLLVFGMTFLTDVSFVVQFLISLIGLGVAIDYSLLLVSRWREERALGADNDTAVRRAIETAGHAVFASGVTVAISLVALLVVPVPFLRSMGLGGMLIPLVSVAVVLTLLPALLSTIGPKVDWPRIRKEGAASRGWSAWARFVVRRKWLAAGAALLALAVLIVPVFDLKIGQAGTPSLARSGPAYEALTQLREGGVGTGVLTPVTVLVPARAADAVAEAAAGVPGVRIAVVGDPGSDSRPAVVDVLPQSETVDSESIGVVERVREAIDPLAADAAITGPGAVVEDYGSAVYDRFPYVMALIMIVTYVLLVRTFRSLLLPLKAVLLNITSLSAVFGAVVYFWQQGNGSGALFDVSATGAITFWLPVLIFAFLFGLSMDYEVFILARMREEYDSTGSTSSAVVTGLGRTGRLVTSAALILFFAFAALSSAPSTDIKMLGTALGVGILIDATIVRALLVPALVGLLGRWNWWLPAGVARVLRVEPSPLAPKGEVRLPADREPAPVG